MLMKIHSSTDVLQRGRKAQNHLKSDCYSCDGDDDGGDDDGDDDTDGG